MGEKKCECKCKSDFKELPVIIGGIVVYELAIIVVLLVLIYLDFDTPCQRLDSVTPEPEETSSVETCPEE